MLMTGTTFYSKKEKDRSSGDQEATQPVKLFQGLFGWFSLDVELQADDCQNE